MKKLLLICLLTLSMVVPAKPLLSKKDGIVSDSIVRVKIVEKTFTGKVKFISGDKLANLGASSGKLKGTVWSQNIKLNIYTQYGKWVKNDFTLYVVETNSGKITFAGLE